MKNIKWIKLKRGNDWGREYIFREGGWESDIEPKTHSILIRWPDGDIENVTMVLGPVHHVKVPDMGHSYDVKFALPGFWADLRGLKKFVELDEVEVDERDFSE